MNSSSQQISNPESNSPQTQVNTKNHLLKPYEIEGVPVFILLLFQMTHTKQLYNIIHWIDDGKAFKIVSRQKFENDVLPKFYKHKNFCSFQRQLNMYDFHKKNRSVTEIIFHHPFFRMDRPDLLAEIKRKSNPLSEHKLRKQKLENQLNLKELKSSDKNSDDSGDYGDDEVMTKKKKPKQQQLEEIKEDHDSSKAVIEQIQFSQNEENQDKMTNKFVSQSNSGDKNKQISDQNESKSSSGRRKRDLKSLMKSVKKIQVQNESHLLLTQVLQSVQSKLDQMQETLHQLGKIQSDIIEAQVQYLSSNSNDPKEIIAKLKSSLMMTSQTTKFTTQGSKTNFNGSIQCGSSGSEHQNSPYQRSNSQGNQFVLPSLKDQSKLVKMESNNNFEKSITSQKLSSESSDKLERFFFKLQSQQSSSERSIKVLQNDNGSEEDQSASVQISQDNLSAKSSNNLSSLALKQLLSNLTNAKRVQPDEFTPQLSSDKVALVQQILNRPLSLEMKDNGPKLLIPLRNLKQVIE